MSKKGKYEEWQTPENLIRLEGWRRDGLDFDQIAKNIGVSRSTLSRWRELYEDIRNALKKGSEVSTYEIENALYKSAKGHFVEEVEIIETDSEKNGKTVTKTKRRRYIPPSIAAQIFILKNRRSDWWREKQIIEMKNDGMLEQLIDGLKEPTDEVIETVEMAETIEDDLHEETTASNEDVAEE